jgi:hypothetical protein
MRAKKKTAFMPSFFAFQMVRLDLARTSTALAMRALAATTQNAQFLLSPVTSSFVAFTGRSIFADVGHLRISGCILVARAAYQKSVPCCPVVFIYEAIQRPAQRGAKAHKEIVKLSGKTLEVKTFLTSWENLLEYVSKISSELTEKAVHGGAWSSVEVHSFCLRARHVF